MKTHHHSQPNEQTHPNLYRLPFLTNISETPDDDPDPPPPTPAVAELSAFQRRRIRETLATSFEAIETQKS